MLNRINKLKTGLATIFTVASCFAFAQSYNITPGDSIVAVSPNSVLTHFNIEQNNLTTGVLVFSWQQISLNIPSGWTTNLCDNGHCYTGFPTSGTMDTVFNGDYGLMAVGINPDTISGTAIIQYAVWEANSPNQKDTLTWIISANGVTGTYNPTNENACNIYPNPANENINLIFADSKKHQFEIFNARGEKIYSGISFANCQLPMACFQSGVYSVSVIENNKTISTKKIIVQH